MAVRIATRGAAGARPSIGDGLLLCLREFGDEGITAGGPEPIHGPCTPEGNAVGTFHERLLPLCGS